jgi:hypothetical protein
MGDLARVIITRRVVTTCFMQVCAVADATDEEILEVCNRKNPSGTEHGWNQVVRRVKKKSLFLSKKSEPEPCEEHPGRLHFLVLC